MIPVAMRHDEDNERDDDRRKCYPEPHPFMSEHAHLSAKYSKFVLSGPMLQKQS